jgi:hypothetical protein
MGVEVAAGAAVIGTGLQAYGQYQAAQAQARAAKQNAKLKASQAKEMIERMRIEELNIAAQGEEFKAAQTATFAKSGVELGTGATLIAMEDTNFKIGKQIETMKRDTMFRANQLIKGAGFEMAQARDSATAGAITAGGTLLQGGANYYKTTA